jgi:phosphatidate cytidylyltransferase
MLKTRIVTALTILPVVLGMLFWAPQPWWAAFVLAIALVGCWEWSRLAGFSPPAANLYLGICGVVGGAFFMLLLRDPQRFGSMALIAFAVSMAFWVAVALPWLIWQWRPAAWVTGVAGILVLMPTWLALVVLRSPALGDWLGVLLVLLVVWIADIAAYFAGKRFGRRKLAPAISPGKTWEGVWGGLLAVALYSLLVAHFFDARSLLKFRTLAGLLLPFALLLAVLSVVGDLFESWLKRVAGRKDSSALLPGHGGVLDRIDALTPVLPLAAFVALVLGR